jgi:hypothetical protein
VVPDSVAVESDAGPEQPGGRKRQMPGRADNHGADKTAQRIHRPRSSLNIQLPLHKRNPSLHPNAFKVAARRGDRGQVRRVHDKGRGEVSEQVVELLVVKVHHPRRHGAVNLQQVSQLNPSHWQVPQHPQSL